MRNDTPSTPRRILRLRDVRARTGLGTSSIYDRVKAGEFPRSIPLGGRAVGWLEDEIDLWIEGRIAEREVAR